MRQKPAIAHARVRLLGAALTGLAAAGGVVEVHTYDQMWHVFTMYCTPRADASNPEQQHSGFAPPSQMRPLTRSGRVAGTRADEGCEHPRLQKLLFAYSSLNLTSAFLRQLASTKDHGQLPWKSNGIPYTLTHYEYPRGVDAAMEGYHTKDHEGVPVADGDGGGGVS